MKNKLICLVGMCGAGKSAVSDYMMEKKKFGYVRFGQITMDEIIKRGEKPSEALEKEIREGFRAEHGMAAYAILNIPKFDEKLKESDVIGDGLYSWEEYLVLKEKYKDELVVIAIYASPKIRYARLTKRADGHENDAKLRYRSFTEEEAASRDKVEIENLHKAGPIAMADYTLINDGTIENLNKQIDKVLEGIYAREKK